jgi:hypothetical protein
MGTHDKSTEPQTQEEDGKHAMSQLYVRQVEDRALPARQVLLQQTQGSEPNDRGTIFVP